MRVLIVSCVFPPELVVSAQTSADLAVALSARGHDVEVVTAFPSRPGGRIYQGWRRSWRQESQTREGYKVLRCFSFCSARSTLGSRFLENISFGMTGAWMVLRATRPDVIYANTWPIAASGLLAAVARIRRIPLVVTVQDVYPESLLSQKRLDPNGLPARCMRAVDRWIAVQCRFIIVISRRFEELYRDTRKVAADRLRYIPNWIGDDFCRASPAETVSFRAAKGIPPEAFLCVYGGNVGAAAGVETLIETFSILRGLDRACYLLVAGEGSRLQGCRKFAEAVANQNVIFHSPWPSQETALVLGAADILLLPTRGRQSRVSVPSKLLAYFLVGRPVLALAEPDTELAALVQSGGGWIVAPDSPAELAHTIESLLTMSSLVLTKKGEQGRMFALGHLTRGVLLPRLVDIVEQAGNIPA